MRFAEAMEAKLRKNDHKKHYKNDTVGELLYKLYEEVDELNDAIHYGSLSPGVDIRDEAVDVANFAMMIWNKHET
jgi:NTP pyrophosphatase (non-canonical NTP hydrolase)